MRNPKTKGDGRSKKRPGPVAQRAAITEAAVDLFIERGTALVSVSEICVRADVGRQTFYRCFTDKDELVEYLYQHAVNDHVEEALARLPNSASGNQWIYDVVDAVIDAILENKKLAQLIYVEAANPNSMAFEVTDRAFEAAAGAMRKWFASNVGDKPSKPYLKSILAATTWLVHDAIIAGAKPAAVAEAKRASRRLFEGAYLSAKQAARRA